MRSAGDGPLPVLAQRVQERAREEVRTLLRDTGLREHRLYVLEIAGRYPCIKIGHSSDPWQRLGQHLAEMNSWQHSLIRAHISDPLSGRDAAKRAERQAHDWMRKHYPLRNRSLETFRGTDFTAGTVCVDTAVSLVNSEQQTAGR